MISIFSWCGLNPFSEIISGYQDSFVLATGMLIDLTYKVQAPLLEGTVGVWCVLASRANILAVIFLQTSDICHKTSQKKTH